MWYSTITASLVTKMIIFLGHTSFKIIFPRLALFQLTVDQLEFKYQFDDVSNNFESIVLNIAPIP